MKRTSAIVFLSAGIVVAAVLIGRTGEAQQILNPKEQIPDTYYTVRLEPSDLLPPDAAFSTDSPNGPWRPANSEGSTKNPAGLRFWLKPLPGWDGGASLGWNNVQKDSPTGRGHIYVTLHYRRRAGSLRVTIEPPVARGRVIWTINRAGAPRKRSGETMAEVPVGVYELSFQFVDSALWSPPERHQVTIVDKQLTEATAVFTRR